MKHSLFKFAMILVLLQAMLLPVQGVGAFGGDVLSVQEADSSELVTVVWDGTYESGCEVTIQTDGGTPEAQACPSGSVIYAAQMTIADARSRGLSDNVVGSADAASVETAIRALQPASGYAPASCSAHYRTVNGSYLSNPGDSASRVRYVLNYALGTNCVVSGVQDKAKKDNSNKAIVWLSSCSDGGSNCAGRGYAALQTAYYLGPYYVPNSAYGNQFRNVSECGNCGFPTVTAYGYWYFD